MEKSLKTHKILRPFNVRPLYLVVKRPVEGVQRVAHRALVRVQTRNDDEA